MEKKELIRRLQQNIPVCWILWEMRNINRTFEDEIHNFEIRTESSSRKHTLYDTVENITSSCLTIVGYHPDQATVLFDMVEELDFILSKDKDGVHKFIIA